MKRVFHLLAGLFALCSVLASSSCDLGQFDENWDRSNGLLDTAIQTLQFESDEWQVHSEEWQDLFNSQSLAWQTVLQDLEQNFTAFLGDTLAPKIQDIGSKLVSQVNSGLACVSSHTVDLAAVRELEVLQNALTGQYKRRDLPIEPTVCSASLNLIESPTVPMDLTYSGYDLAHPDVHLFLVNAAGQESPGDHLLSSRDNFKLALRLDHEMYATLNEHEWLLVKYKDKVLSQLKIQH